LGNVFFFFFFFVFFFFFWVICLLDVAAKEHMAATSGELDQDK
jgi:hypothetical protein